MDVKQYLNQSYWLDQLITCEGEEIRELCDMSVSISAVQYEENLIHPDNTNARFVKLLYRIEEQKLKLLDEINLLITLKTQIRAAIDTVPSIRDRLILQYRHLQNQPWESIADNLKVSRRSVIRWYNEAVGVIVMPENPIDVNEFLQKK